MKPFRVSVILLVVGIFLLTPILGYDMIVNIAAIKWHNRGVDEKDINKAIKYLQHSN